jgi:hypothetical protein
LFLSAGQTLAWHDATHMAVVTAAGLDDYAYLAVGADMAKEKAGAIEQGNHYHNTPRGVKITPAMVVAQVRDYNRPGDADGHLYGAIIGAINDYRRRQDSGKYALYPFGYAAHYMGDLSMPFHNIVYDDFNRENHGANDGIVESSSPRGESTQAKVARLAGEIRKRLHRLPPLSFSRDEETFQRQLAAEIARIANQASALGYAMKHDTPQRTRLSQEEAYAQLALSARLLQAVAAVVLDR